MLYHTKVDCDSSIYDTLVVTGASPT